MEKKQWQSWADKLILYNDELEDWIYDVAVAKNKEEVFLAIAHEKITEVFYKETSYWEPDIVLGYYYLVYQEKRMNLSEFLSKLTDEDDISSEAKIFNSQETRDMLSKAKMGKLDITKIDELLMPFTEEALRQLEILLHYMIDNCETP